MEKSNTQSQIDKEMEEFMKQNKDVMYKRISQQIGSRVDEGNKEKRRAIDGKFTKVNILFLFSTWHNQEIINLMA